MLYQVGDSVMIRPDLNTSTRYKMIGSEGTNAVTEDMRDMAGTITVITAISWGQYVVNGSAWRWTDEMFAYAIEDDFEPDNALDDFLSGVET